MLGGIRDHGAVYGIICCWSAVAAHRFARELGWPRPRRLGSPIQTL